MLRWRQFKFVYAADIAKMYRQILVDQRDLGYQRILWIHPTSQIQKYQLQTVTYGMISAPFLALRVLQQLVQDEGTNFPLASSIIKDNTYVDDVLFGADNLDLALLKRRQVIEMLKRAGFVLRKWTSNSDELLSSVPVADHGFALCQPFERDHHVHILGISWSPHADSFQFELSLSASPPRTKRSILSAIASLYDPLGWVTPVIVSATVLIQQLWRLNLTWDEVVSSPLLSKWELIYTELEQLNGLLIPRWIHITDNALSYEVHGFADASTTAYAAAVYLKVVTVDGNTRTSLLASKSKVAPLKPVTVPRLELSAAVLLSRLIEFVRASLNLYQAQYYCWTDSMITLAWSTQHPSRWKTFVANRTADIQSRIPFATWEHVPSQDNPADCASRGCLGFELPTFYLWWQGPAWLRKSPDFWPSATPSVSTDHIPDLKLGTFHISAVLDSWDLATRYSSWPKLTKVTAYIMRFVRNCRQSHSAVSGPAADNRSTALHKHNITTATPPTSFSVEELQHAKIFWLGYVQRENFPREYDDLCKGRSISTRSALYSLNPFLDDSRLIRVGGRLHKANSPVLTRHPIILSAHSVVQLLIQHAHMRSLHAGPQLTMSTLRQEYWILRMRTLVKSVIHKCITCFRERAAAPTQLMGSLPRFRISAPTRPFLHSGVDYAGPILIRASAGRGITSRKAYIAVFVCLASRAIHLELVGSYSTSSFLDAFSRFCSRRGLPESMYSDNGTTFSGADHELSTAYQQIVNNSDFLNRLAVKNVSWHFIPPPAPHFGGLWEAGVRSVKYHLRRVLGSHTLTYEEFSTVLCRVEASLNSRPLGPISDALDDYEPLTPGHLLIGSALTAIPEPSVLNIDESRLSRWQLIRHLTERFWKLWQTDYINTLQQRAKWRKVQPDLRVGQLVLLRHPNLPPCKWKVGRILACHPGEDNLVCFVTIKTATSEFKRPIT